MQIFEYVIREKVWDEGCYILRRKAGEVAADLAGKGDNRVRCLSSSLAKCLGAYKNVSEVVRVIICSGIAKPVVGMVPVFVVKG